MDLFAKPLDFPRIEARIRHFSVPAERRWLATPLVPHPKRTLTIELKSLADARAHGLVALGRGGIFIATGETFEVGELLEARLVFTEDSLARIAMVGLVRWHRNGHVTYFHDGIGIEVLSADPQAQDILLAARADVDNHSFIPLGEKERDSHHLSRRAG